MEPKFHVGQPVIVKPIPVGDEGFIGFEGTVIEVNFHSSRGKYGYKVSDDPNNLPSNMMWKEEVVYPRNPDCKGNGKSWEDVKRSLKSIKQCDLVKN